jgi:hypothetical protein
MGNRHTAEAIKLWFPELETTDLLRATIVTLWRVQEWEALLSYILGAEDLAFTQKLTKLTEELQFLREIVKTRMGNQ